MSRTRTYADFETAVAAKIGENMINVQLGEWINIAFNEKYRDAVTAAQWPDLVLWEPRNPDGNGLIAYSQQTDPTTGLAVKDIEYVWGIYQNSPYQNLSLRTAKYTLNDQGAMIIFPASTVNVNGYIAQVAPIGPYYMQYVPAIPQFTGDVWSASNSYHYNDVVYDATTGDYYQCILVNANIALANTNYWNTISIANWSAVTAYSIGNIVYDPTSSIYYRAIATSTNQAVTNLNYWTPVTVTPYATAQNYDLNGLVYSESTATFYKCILANSNKLVSNTTYWTTVTISAYSSSTTYQPYDVVFVPGAATYYQCLVSSLNNLLSNPVYWQQIAIVGWNSTTSYTANQIVYSASTPTYYTCILDTIQQVLTQTNYWQRLRIYSVLFNYLVHAVYAAYLLTNKQNDKHKTEMAYADQLLLNEKQRLIIGENQKPVTTVYTHLNTQYRS